MEIALPQKAGQASVTVKVRYYEIGSRKTDAWRVFEAFDYASNKIIRRSKIWSGNSVEITVFYKSKQYNIFQ